MRLKKILIVIIAVAVIGAGIVIVKRLSVPDTAAAVKEYVAQKGADNIRFADFVLLPHRQIAEADSVYIEHDLRDGNKLILCGSDNKVPISVILIYADGTEELLKSGL